MSSRLPLLALCALSLQAQPFDPALYGDMKWRMIGPFRGGRTVGAAGVPQQPSVYYMAANNGGVWKSTDYGHVWKPIFDGQPTQSIGAIAISPSDPNILYVASGEGLQRPDLSVGDGIYKSTDAGRTWTHLGLRDGQQINTILIDPRDPNRVFVAVLGHPYGPNAERGVFRSTDGGASWKKILYEDENTGAIDLVFDPTDSRTIYADLWAARQGPWENGAWNGPQSGVFKSKDGGDTWTRLTQGLPSASDGLARVGLAIAPGDHNRLYAMVDANPRVAGLFRSDDAGASWRRVNNEQRIWGRGGDFAMVRVDPKNADKVYVANTSTYRSTDAGANFTAIKGAPGGDDYHTIWINPDHPEIILLGLDQGATLTVNGGETWSSWYNQPTAQFYHVITDNRFPYWVYGAQQESGSVGTSSRGDSGEITFRDWHPVGVEEYGYIAPDPLNPNLIYGGKATRYDQTTGQTQDIGPNAGRGGGKYRFLRTAPLLFSPVDPHVLYLGAQVLLKTTNGGANWQPISPDLSRETWDVPSSVGIYSSQVPDAGRRRGVIYTIAPSYKDGNVIWCGTDDGLIQLTKNGGVSWVNVTPKELTAWSKVSVMDASHFEPGGAYAAINRFRLDDLKPHIYRTHDFGRSWTEIVAGLPGGPVNAVKEDPLRRGMLFAGTERGVFVSFNDGDNWQPLQMNLPPTSIRDLVIHDDDLVVGTHGRSFWILDDITPLRQLSPAVAASDAFLFKPQTTYRVRRSNNPDTPLPPEEPAGQNPPDGAVIDYLLKSDGPVTLEIMDSSGKPVRTYSSADKPEPVNERELNIPMYWVRMPKVLPGTAGMHRWQWDLRYAPPPAQRDYPISAIYRDTPAYPLGTSVLPGMYTAKLTAAGKTMTQTFTVKMDPRVKTTPSGLARQFELSRQVCELMRQGADAQAEIRAFREKHPSGDLDSKAAAISGDGGGGRRGGRGGGTGPENLSRLNAELAGVLAVLDSADAAPTSQATAAVADLARSTAVQLKAWKELSANVAK